MLSLFFVPSIDAPVTKVVGEEAHHISKVLRMSVGEELLLSDGIGNWGRGEITSLSKAEVVVTIAETGLAEKSQPNLTVIQALPKSERVKETIELLTEAGVDRIIPWQSSRSISKLQSDSIEKWQQGALAAAKQSRRFIFPEILAPYSVTGQGKELFKNSWILTCHESAQTKLSSVFQYLFRKASQRFSWSLVRRGA